MIGFRNGRGGASFTRQPFFLLDSQVIRIFRLKNRLIILRAVTYVIRKKMCFRAARDQPGNYWLAIFLEQQPARRGCTREINLAGLRYDRIVHEPKFGPWLGSVFM